MTMYEIINSYLSPHNRYPITNKYRKKCDAIIIFLMLKRCEGPQYLIFTFIHFYFDTIQFRKFLKHFFIQKKCLQKFNVTSLPPDFGKIPFIFRILYEENQKETPETNIFSKINVSPKRIDRTGTLFKSVFVIFEIRLFLEVSDWSFFKSLLMITRDFLKSWTITV